MIELEQVHLNKILQMPGGTTEILHRGRLRETVTSLFLDDNVVVVKRTLESGDKHERLVPLSNIQSMEKYGRKAEEKSAEGSVKRSRVVQGTAAAGRGSDTKEKGKGRSKVKAK